MLYPMQNMTNKYYHYGILVSCETLLHLCLYTCICLCIGIEVGATPGAEGWLRGGV